MTAVRAEAVPAVPVQERGRICRQRGLVRRQLRGGLPQRRRPPAARLAVADLVREERRLTEKAEEDGLLGGLRKDEPCVLHPHASLREEKGPRTGLRASRFDPVGTAPFVGGAIETRVGEGQRRAHF